MDDFSRKRKLNGDRNDFESEDRSQSKKKRPSYATQAPSDTPSSPQIAANAEGANNSYWDTNSLLLDMLDDSDATSQTQPNKTLEGSTHQTTDRKTSAKRSDHSVLDILQTSSPPSKITASSTLELANQLHDSIMAQMACWDEPTTDSVPVIESTPKLTPVASIVSASIESQTRQLTKREPDAIPFREATITQPTTLEKSIKVDQLMTAEDHSATAKLPIQHETVIWRPTATTAIATNATTDRQHTQAALKSPLRSDELQKSSSDSQQNTQTLQQLDNLQPWTEALEIQLDRLKLHTTPPRLPRHTNAKRANTASTNVLTPEDSTLQLWWYDAHHPYKDGTILLFGKVLEHTTNTYASCCVFVKNIERTIFVLPRRYRFSEDEYLQTERVIMDDVIEEITQLFRRYHIRDWRWSIRRRKYAFEFPDVPAEADYLKIRYSFKEPELATDINGSTFSHIFGTNASPMELFLVKRGIKGPQWLEIKDAQDFPRGTKGTWCQYEFSVSGPKKVHVLQGDRCVRNLDSPPLSVMSLHLHTMANAKSNANEIIAAGIFLCPKLPVDQMANLEDTENSRFVVVRPFGVNDTQWPADLDEAIQQQKQEGLPIQAEDSEYSLLNYLCGKIHLYDPDIIIGHGFSRFTLDVLLHRIKACNIPFWHKLGRIRWKRKPQLQYGPGGTGVFTPKERALLAGRLMCDTMTMCRALIHAKSYHLSSLAETQLGIKRAENNTIIGHRSPIVNKTKTTLQLAKHCWMDSYLAMALLFKFQMLPLSKKLTNISGNLWARSLEESRMNRNEYLLMHEFHKMKYIYPDKARSDSLGIGLDGLVEIENDTVAPMASTNRKKKQPFFGGGLVLEPKTGLHENFVVLLDFNSLYPSIIQEFNICFTTVDKLEVGGDDFLPNIPSPDVPLGVLPRLMKRIVDERKLIKHRMKVPGIGENELAQYDIEQNALKLTANSLYGSLGSGFSRFKARHLAAMITSQGRSILRETVDAVEQQLGMDVVYGDTDSIMVATTEQTVEKAQEIAKQVQNLINRKYHLLELGIDGYFRRLLILGKKNYASLTVTRQKDEPNNWVDTIIPKGSSIIRKDLCDVSSYATMRVLKSILSGDPHKIESVQRILKKINRLVRTDSIPLGRYTLHKQLTKDLDKYTSSKGQTHVQVALKLRKLGHILKAGDTVVYVICLTDDESNATMADKAMPVAEIENKNCRIDYDWYLRHEILPSVTRLCQPVMDTSEFAPCLGLEVEKKWSENVNEQQQRRLRRRTQLIQQNKDHFTNFKTLDRTTDIQPFNLHCQHCRNKVEIKSYATYNKDEGWVSGMQCPKCRGMMTTASVSTQLVLAIRYYIKLYYQGWLCCQVLDCNCRTRDCAVYCMNSSACDGHLVREYTGEMLYAQLLYFDGIFDIKEDASLDEYTVDQGTPKKTIVDQYGQAFAVLRKTVRRYLDQCGYRFVDISDYIDAYNDCK